MSKVVNNNKACCSIPPVQAEYSPKGSYETVEGLKTYVTGASDAKNVIVYVYDIFTFSPQALQGADLLAAGSCARVVMPDFFEGETVSPDLFSPPSSDEKSAAIQKVFSTFANPAKALPRLESIVKGLKSQCTEKVGAIGFCWGAKVTFLAPSLDAKATFHPSLLAKGDADAIEVPVALWPSKDEDKEIMASLHEVLQKKAFAEKNAYHVYDSLPHGWAGARADFKKEDEAEAFHAAYETASKWFTSVF